MWVVSVVRPGFGRYQGGSYVKSQSFKDWDKAREYYTDMIVKYPNYEVNLFKSEK